MPIHQDRIASLQSQRQGVGTAAQDLPPRNDARRQQIRAHIERNIGPIRRVFHDDAPEGVHLDVHHAPPTEARPWHTLITAGMSDARMRVPANVDTPAYMELIVTLPEDWQVSDAANQQDEWSWPIRLLRQVARFPHAHRTWVDWGHLTPNGDPPRPYATNTKLCGAIIVPSLLVPQAFYELTLADRSIAFFSVVPVYQEEMDLQQRKGMAALLERLIDRDIKDCVSPQRRNVAKRFFGLF